MSFFLPRWRSCRSGRLAPFAIQIIQILQLLEVGMAMTAQYQVDITGGWGYLGIVDAIYLPAQVGDADDDITLLFFSKSLSFPLPWR